MTMQKKDVFALKQTSIDKFKLKCSQVFLFICVCLCVLTIYINVTYSIAPVSGSSMCPTLNYGEGYSSMGLHDRVVLNYIKTCQKGDIIVAKKIYDDDSEHYIYVIKRLIATGGDKLEIKEDGTVVINGKELVENYTSQNKSSTYNNFIGLKTSFANLFEGNVMTIPEGYVFYLGDNRGGSYDCSCYGPVKESTIIAKVDFILKANQNDFVSIIKQIFKIK